MRIVRLKIHKYKNLVNCEFDFSNSEGLLVVAGINGSGKSNLLEAILLIMKDVFSIPKPVNVDWPLYEISFAGKNELLTALRDSIECKSPRVVREQINGAGEVVHEQPSVVYMYSGEFNRIYNSRLGYVGEYELSSGFYSITAEDLNVATIVLAIKSQSDDIRDGESLINLPMVTAITFHSDGIVPVDGESGPVNELEDLSSWLSQQAEDDGKICVHIGSLSDKLDQLGVVNSRDQYYVLYQMLAETGVYGLSIVDIELEMSPGQWMSIENLSEGEKHLLLLRCACEVLGIENSLVLLDEPDAHMHEGRKIDLYNYLEAKSKDGSLTVCTSHSPTFVNKAPSGSLLGLQVVDSSKICVVPDDDLRVLQTIHDDRMLLFSKKPLLFFEGKSDVNLIRRAIQAFRDKKPGYENLTVDNDFEMCITGGTGDARYVYGQFRRMFPRRLIYMCFDNDEDGLKALSSVTTPDEGFPGFRPLSDITDGLSRLDVSCGGAFLLPVPTDGYSAKENTIEDYLSSSYIKAEIDRLTSHCVHFHDVVNIKKALKKHIANAVWTMQDEDLYGFAPIVDILKGLPVR